MKTNVKLVISLIICLFMHSTIYTIDIKYPTITGMIEGTFLTKISDPAENALFATKMLQETNEIVFEYIQKNNSTLGIKNSDITKSSNNAHKSIMSLINAINILKGIVYKGAVFDKEKGKILKNLDIIRADCLSNALFADKASKRKIPPLLQSSKELFSIIVLLAESTISFIDKLKDIIGNT